MVTKFTGIIPAFVTPLQEDNTINHAVAQRLLDWHLAQGADGFYICGATGEGLVMQPEARMDFAQAVVRHLAGRKPCIAHVAAIDLTTTVKLARQAEAVGCDCVAAIPPIYFAYGEGDIYNYYRAIADAVHIPVMIYYHPAAGVDLSDALMDRLFEVENIRAVKWSKPDYYAMMRLLDRSQGDVNVLNGPDETLLCGLACGADGGIGTSYNVLLPRIKSLYECFRAGDIDGARRHQYAVDRILAVMLTRPIIPATKMVLSHMGFDVGYATWPMPRICGGEADAMLAALKAAGMRLQQ